MAQTDRVDVQGIILKILAVAGVVADLKIGKAILYLVVDELEGDRPYREFFKLH